MKRLALFLALLTLPACGQHLAGTTYRASVGRQVTEFMQRDATTTWNVGAEVRFDVNRCGGCHGSLLPKDSREVRL